MITPRIPPIDEYIAIIKIIKTKVIASLGDPNFPLAGHALLNNSKISGNHFSQLKKIFDIFSIALKTQASIMQLRSIPLTPALKSRRASFLFPEYLIEINWASVSTPVFRHAEAKNMITAE